MPDPVAPTPTPEKPPVEGTPSPSAPSPDPASPAPKAEGQPGSIYKDVGLEEPGKEGSTSWPSTWREDMVKGIENPKAADVLKRYQSPADMAKALISAQEKIRSGEYKRVAAPDMADAEAVKAWRLEQGIPASPDEYELPQVAGVDMAKLDDATKENVAAIRTTFHEANLTKEQAVVVSKAMTDLAERTAAAEAQADARAATAVEDALRADWGSEYRTNIAMNVAFMEQTFGKLTDGLLEARLPDGRRLVDVPEFSKSINAMARANGSDVIFDGDKGGGTSIAARRAEIEKIMQTDFGRYQREFADEYTKILNTMDERGQLKA
jgi:hypothetical protein